MIDWNLLEIIIFLSIIPYLITLFLDVEVFIKFQLIINNVLLALIDDTYSHKWGATKAKRKIRGRKTNGSTWTFFL